MTKTEPRIAHLRECNERTYGRVILSLLARRERHAFTVKEITEAVPLYRGQCRCFRPEPVGGAGPAEHF